MEERIGLLVLRFLLMGNIVHHPIKNKLTLYVEKVYDNPVATKLIES